MTTYRTCALRQFTGCLCNVRIQFQVPDFPKELILITSRSLNCSWAVRITTYYMFEELFHGLICVGNFTLLKEFSEMLEKL